MSTNHAGTLVVLRHGIKSNAGALWTLEQHLRKVLPGCTVDNQTYDWGDFVLHSGISLAEDVLAKLTGSDPPKRVIFVGHSQGGLVCRVAVATLCGRVDLLEALRFRTTPHDGYYTVAQQQLKALPMKYTHMQLDAACDAVFSVVMLGTPNAGAISNGQMTIEASAIAWGTRKLASLRWKNFDELTSDRLFTLLQGVRVRRVQYVSISGSSASRYSSLTSAHLSLAQIPVLNRLAVALDLPNDGVVEDSSVDLRESPLPCEIADLDQQYEHVRSYTECIRVGHTDLHSDQNVLDALDRIPRWK